jgi:hypothetical protein
MVHADALNQYNLDALAPDETDPHGFVRVER